MSKCSNCQKAFKPDRADQAYCNRSCKRQAQNARNRRSQTLPPSTLGGIVSLAQIASTIRKTATVPVPDLSEGEARALDAVAWLCLPENEGHAWTAAVAAAEDLTDSEADRAHRSLCSRGLIEYTGTQSGERFYILTSAT